MGQNIPCFELGGFIAVDMRLPLHEAGKLRAQDLTTSWNALRDYVRQACALIRSDTPTWLDSDEVDLIRDKLGEPPGACYPLYIITVSDPGGMARIVYIGRTSSKVGRFARGHRALITLHDPLYRNSEKHICLCCVMLVTATKEYVPLEAVGPLVAANRILNSVEYQLIFHYQPELNTHGKKRSLATIPIILHLQNFASEFPPECFIYE
jgi:hypothetical protein